MPASVSSEWTLGHWVATVGTLREARSRLLRFVALAKFVATKAVSAGVSGSSHDDQNIPITVSPRESFVSMGKAA